LPMAIALLKEPVEAPGPIAVEPTPSACAPWPSATEFVPAAALVPNATEFVPAVALAPTASELSPAEALGPNAKEFVPFAAALAPQSSDDAAADAPLLLKAIELTTGVVVGVTAVRRGAVVTLTPLTNAALAGVTLVIALLEGVVRPVPLVKKLFC